MRRVVGPLRVHHLSGDMLEPCHHASRNPQGPLRTAANLRSKHGSHSRAISCHILPSTKSTVAATCESLEVFFTAGWIWATWNWPSLRATWLKWPSSLCVFFPHSLRLSNAFNPSVSASSESLPIGLPENHTTVHYRMVQGLWTESRFSLHSLHVWCSSEREERQSLDQQKTSCSARMVRCGSAKEAAAFCIFTSKPWAPSTARAAC